MRLVQRNALVDDHCLIKLDKFERILARFSIRLHAKQRDLILKLQCVDYVGDPTVINVQSFLDV